MENFTIVKPPVIQHIKDTLETNTKTGVKNPERPVDVWTQESNDGSILFVVFYTQACRWQKCIGCNFHDNASKTHIGYEQIIKQIDHVFANVDMTGVNKIILSNGGSMLDQETFSTTALIYLVCHLNIHFKDVKIISLETRLEYVDMAELEILKRALIEGNSETELEVGIGFEAYDDVIRNVMFKKGFDKVDFEKFLDVMEDFKFNVKCYFMLKPVPNITTDEAIKDIHDAIRYLNQCSIRYQTKINMHLNPTYVAKGSKLEEAFINSGYEPPTLWAVADAIYVGKDIDNPNFSIYVGLSDEGLAVEGGSFIRNPNCSIERANIHYLEEFNRTQDYENIKMIVNALDYID